MSILLEHEGELELRRHVEALAGFGERSVFRPQQLAAAAAYIETSLTQPEYPVRRHTYHAAEQACSNLELEMRGRSRPEEIVVIGAHYDSVPGSPGANDNGSGVAALLVLARRLRETALQRTLRFVAFVNEEPPHFQTESMGSLVYARGARKRRDKIVAMLSLETIGYYSDEPHSQRYPAPLAMLYPSTGNFIGFVSNVRYSRLLRQCIKYFRRQSAAPCEGAALPGAIPGVAWSDHWAFWQFGYPAVMVTDTAPFRYPYYHTAEDTPDKLDYVRMAKVVDGLAAVIRRLTDG